MILPLDRVWSALLVAWREHVAVESVRSGKHGAGRHLKRQLHLGHETSLDDESPPRLSSLMHV